MATTYHNDIQKLYVAYFNRPADFAGLNYYETIVEAAGGSTAAISAEFAKSKEYTDTYAGLSVGARVDAIYQNIFGHAADAAGKAYWTDLLTKGTVTLDAAVTDIAKGAQGTDLTAYNNKVKAAALFTAALDTEAEQKGYSGDKANAEAKEWLGTISTDASFNANTTPAALSAAVAESVAAGTVFTLEGALASLAAANEAKADFLQDSLDNDGVAAALEDAGIDAEDATDAQIEAAIDAAATTAATDIDAIIAGYSGHTAAVREAELKLAQAQAAEAIDAATGAVTEAKADVATSKGLSAAIANLESATDTDEAATEAAALAVVAVSTQESTFNVKNGVTLSEDGVTHAYSITKSGVTTVVAELNDDGVYEVPSGVNASKLTGLTAFVAALNTEITTAEAATKAAAALVLAGKNVDYMDVAAGAEAAHEAVYDAFVFNKPAIADKPTAEEIAAETEAFTVQLADLDAAAAAATPGDTYADVLADIGADLSAAGSVAAIKAITATARTEGWISAADKAAIDKAATGADAATLLGDNNYSAHSTVFNDAVADLVTAEDGVANLLVDALTTAEGNLETAAGASEDLAAAVASYADAAQLAGNLDAQDAVIAAALQVFEDNDKAVPVTLTGIKLGTSADDIFLSGSADATVRSFGTLGDDVLYIGTDYTLNPGKLSAGKDSVLEVFIIADGDDTMIKLEKTAFGSSASTPEVITITLTGVDAADVSLDAKGFITVA